MYEIESGDNMYKVLQNMTLKELEDYWNHRLLWTNWLKFD
jgi:hypothetical protein